MRLMIAQPQSAGLTSDRTAVHLLITPVVKAVVLPRDCPVYPAGEEPPLISRGPGDSSSHHPGHHEVVPADNTDLISNSDMKPTLLVISRNDMQ